MFNFRLYALLFTALRIASKAEQRSGILQVSVRKQNGFSPCHDCLVKGMGVSNIYLLEQRRNEKVYWVRGHSDMSRTFQFTGLWDIQICRERSSINVTLNESVMYCEMYVQRTSWMTCQELTYNREIQLRTPKISRTIYFGFLIRLSIISRNSKVIYRTSTH